MKKESEPWHRCNKARFEVNCCMKFLKMRTH